MEASHNSRAVASTAHSHAPNDDDDAPAENYEYNALAYGIIVLWGFALLLPWNVMLNAIPYFKQEFPTDGSIAFHMTAAYVYPQLPILLGMVPLGGRVPLSVRVLACLGTQAAAVVAIPILAPSHNIWAALSMIFVIGVTTAVLQSSIFGFTSIFPSVFSQGMMSGQGIAGITAGVLAIIIDATIPNDASLAAMIYFSLAAATLLAAAGSYVLMMRLPFTQWHMRRAGMSGGAAGGAAGGEGRVMDGKGGYQRVGSADDAAALTLNGEPLIAKGEEPASSIWSVLWALRVEATAVFMVFFVTFIVFPGVAPSQISFKQSLGKLQMSDSWWTLILLLIFNLFDTAGRALPAVLTSCKGLLLLVCTFIRFVTVPLFYGAAHNWSASMNDVFVAVLMAAFAITNGYMASMAMMTGPAHVFGKDRERAGFLMSFFLQAGILVGSCAAFGFTGGP